MEYFYDKQIKNILSWHELSENSLDNYMAFMSEWIAFNAICYNLYYKKAVKERANLESTRNQLQIIRDNFNESDILNVVETKVTNHRANGCSLTPNNDKWKVNINLQNSNLKLSIASNYTEDIIFNEFVDAYDEWYTENTQLSNEIFNSLKLSLKKGERNFVINMAKHNFYKEENDINCMAQSNIIIICEENNLKTIKNVLYQIRCNIFHGAKTPGDAEDDKIVESALPILRLLVHTLITDCKINNNR
jgi:hypothetical protein